MSLWCPNIKCNHCLNFGYHWKKKIHLSITELLKFLVVFSTTYLYEKTFFSPVSHKNQTEKLNGCQCSASTLRNNATAMVIKYSSKEAADLTLSLFELNIAFSKVQDVLLLAFLLLLGFGLIK